VKIRRMWAVGFTMIELMVVVSIIGILMGMLFPVVWSLDRSVRMNGAVSTIGAAVAAARVAVGQGGHFAVDGYREYRGMAVLFTPGGELRLVESVDARRLAMGGGAPPDLIDENNNPLDPEAGAFDDIRNRDYLMLPNGVGVVGIARGAAGTGIAGLKLLTPPIAIRFDGEGKLVSGAAISGVDERLVYYDGNYDGEYDTNVDRTNPYTTSPYNPAVWDSTDDNFDDTTKNPVSVPGRHTGEDRENLPFEEIETVVGVLVFSKAEVVGEGLNLISKVGTGAPVNNMVAGWLLEDNDSDGELDNSQVMFFSRYTGVVVK